MASCIQRCIRLRAWRRRAAARKGGEGKHENKAVSLRESIQSGIILCVGLSTQNVDQLLACVGSHRGKGATSAPFQLTGSSSSVTVSSVNLETKYYSAHAWVCDTSSQGYRCDGTGTGWEDKEELGAGGEGCCALIIMVDSSDSEAMVMSPPWPSSFSLGPYLSSLCAFYSPQHIERSIHMTCLSSSVSLSLSLTFTSPFSHPCRQQHREGRLSLWSPHTLMCWFALTRL